MENEGKPRKQTWAILGVIIVILIFLIIGISSSQTTSQPISNAVDFTGTKDYIDNTQNDIILRYENKIGELSTRIEELNNSISNAQKEITDLQSENNSLKEQNHQLEEDKKALEAQIDNLKSQNNSNNNTSSSTTSTKSTKSETSTKSISSNSSNTNNSQSRTVYITDTGSKYHSSSCSYLKKSKRAISLNDAKSQGYTPCSRCNP